MGLLDREFCHQNYYCAYIFAFFERKMSTLPATATWHIDRRSGLKLIIKNGSKSDSVKFLSCKAIDKLLIEINVCRGDGKVGDVLLPINQYQNSEEDKLTGISNAFEFCR